MKMPKITAALPANTTLRRNGPQRLALRDSCEFMEELPPPDFSPEALRQSCRWLSWDSLHNHTEL